jgi:LacI family transcriptional regulator
MSTPAPSLRAVASAAGVSVSTASRALADKTSVAPELRKRVASAARRLGYRRSALASEIMREFRGRQGGVYRGLLAVLAPGVPREWRARGQHYNEGLLAAIQARAQRLGYAAEVFRLDEPGVSLARLGDILAARGVRGVILLPLPQRTPALAFPWEKFAAVKIGYMLESPPLHRLTNDFYQQAGMILRRLEASDYRRIGLLVEQSYEDRRARIIEARFALHQQALPAARRVPALAQPTLDPESVFAWWKKFRPDAIVAHNPRAHAWLLARRVRIPEDTGLAVITASEESPQVAGIVPPRAEMGAAAVDLLTSLMAHGETGVPASQRTLQIAGHWQEGATLRPAAHPVPL